MRHNATAVVERALEVLDTYGLADLTMRRLGAELGVQASAIYHHFATKQLLLAALADRVLAGVDWEACAGHGSWRQATATVCEATRDALLRYRDGAELVSTVHSFGLGARAPHDALRAALGPAQLGPELTDAAARALLHLVFGHTLDEQVHLQAASAGAIADDPRSGSDFAVGLGLVIDGIATRTGHRQRVAGDLAPGVLTT